MKLRLILLQSTMVLILSGCMSTTFSLIPAKYDIEQAARIRISNNVGIEKVDGKPIGGIAQFWSGKAIDQILVKPGHHTVGVFYRKTTGYGHNI